MVPLRTKDGYPISQRKKPPKTVLKEYPNSLEEWEERVFRDALYFTVVRFGYVSGGEVCTLKTFPEAIYVAHQNERSLLYAVDTKGNGFCMPRKEYEKYARIWLALKGAKDTA